MSKRIVVLVVLFAVIFGAILTAPRIVNAQETGRVVCDSTLMTLYYIAQRDYGFQSMTDTTNFEYGQFSPWFSSMAGMATPDASMATPDMAATPDAMMTPDASMMLLMPGLVANENASCATLRSELESFFWARFNTGQSQ